MLFGFGWAPLHEPFAGRGGESGQIVLAEWPLPTRSTAEIPAVRTMHGRCSQELKPPRRRHWRGVRRMVGWAPFPSGTNEGRTGTLQGRTIGLRIARVIVPPLPPSLSAVTYPRSFPRKGGTLQRNWPTQGRPGGYKSPCIARRLMHRLRTCRNGRQLPEASCPHWSDRYQRTQRAT